MPKFLDAVYCFFVHISAFLPCFFVRKRKGAVENGAKIPIKLLFLISFAFKN